MPKRVHELAKELGMDTTSVLIKLEEAGVHGKKAQSPLTDSEIARIMGENETQAPAVLLGEAKLVSERVVNESAQDTGHSAAIREEVQETRIHPNVIRRRVTRVEAVSGPTKSEVEPEMTRSPRILGRIDLRKPDQRVPSPEEKTPPFVELKKLLTDVADRDDPALAPKALRTAFAWCTDAMTPDKLVQRSRVDILSILADLVKALNLGRSFLSAMPELLDQAVAGERLRQAIQGGEAAVVRGAEEIEQLRETLAPLSQQEEALRAQAAERDALMHRRAELERFVKLAEGVAELRQQVAELDKYLSLASPDIEQLEGQVEQKANRLVVVSEGTLANLGRSARNALELAESKERERREAEVQLRSAIERYRQANTELHKLNETLRPYSEADRAVARAIPGAHSANEILDEVERLLQQADQALQQALKANGKPSSLANSF